MPVRTLILSAPVGESHVAMARSLAADLQRRDGTAAVEVRNGWDVLGPALGRILGRGYTYHLGEVTWSYDLTYRLVTGVRAVRQGGELALAALGGAPLAATVARYRPDIVVSTHPVISAVLGRLRGAGRLPCPVALVVGPLGGLDFWVHPGADLHLLNYAESLPEVEREAPRSRAVPVRPLVDDAFFAAPSRAEARAGLGLSLDRRLVLISGGGWGAGDLDGSIRAALQVPGTEVIAVTGRNERLYTAMRVRHAGEPRVTVLGFSDRMPQLLSAADVFVTATAGLSCLEAQLCRCPVVCYGFVIGHIRDNVRALERHRLALAAAEPAQLTERLAAVLGGSERVVEPDRTALPHAGDELIRAAAGSPAPAGRPSAV